MGPFASSLGRGRWDVEVRPDAVVLTPHGGMSETTYALLRLGAVVVSIVLAVTAVDAASGVGRAVLFVLAGLLFGAVVLTIVVQLVLTVVGVVWVAGSLATRRGRRSLTRPLEPRAAAVRISTASVRQVSDVEGRLPARLRVLTADGELELRARPGRRGALVRVREGLYSSAP